MRVPSPQEAVKQIYALRKIFSVTQLLDIFII